LNSFSLQDVSHCLRNAFHFYTRTWYFFSLLSFILAGTRGGCYTRRRYMRIGCSKKLVYDRGIPIESIESSPPGTSQWRGGGGVASKLAAKFPVVKAAKNRSWFYKTRVTWAMMLSSRWQNTYYSGKIKPEPRPRSLSGRLFVVNKIKKKMKFRFVELHQIKLKVRANITSCLCSVLSAFPFVIPVKNHYPRNKTSVDAKPIVGTCFFLHSSLFFFFFSYIANEVDIDCISIIRLRVSVSNKYDDW